MSAESEPAALRRARLVVAYDGASYHGFAETPPQRTVVGVLRAAIEKVAGMSVELVGAGRTDAGVHAWGQVISGDLPATMDLAGLQHRINRMCGPTVVVRDAQWADSAQFNARFDATYRHYRYDVVNAAVAVPALAPVAWHVAGPLNLWAMQLACDPLIGEHDFSSFCRVPKVRPDQRTPSLRRRVMLAEWNEVHSDHGPLLRFEIRANAFCQQMVRSIVGTMVDIGAGRLPAGDLRSIMLSRDRSVAGQVAPAHGLTLWHVGY